MGGLRFVVFDMDGTLFDAWSVAFPAFVHTFRALRERGVAVALPPEEDLRKTLGMTYRKMWRTLLGFDDPELALWADRTMRAKELELLEAGEGRLYPGVVEGISELAASGLALYIASNGEANYLTKILERFSLRPYFSGVYDAFSFRVVRKEELVGRILDEHGLSPAEGAIVGDRVSDVEAGTAHGLHRIACTYGYGSPEELRGADVYVQSFPEAVRVLLARKSQGEVGGGISPA
ncbi:MAG: Phosphoglycolate phosphatase [Brockia lithotrophica]|uniref:Phosphoglycolate phosphatase n=1 Tax=Brockia lithotrophica TaxID=933949 RepID=A0A2T5G522_9BACL|nr:HAD family hydrolase [Brockia lithotrophica]PTQ51287.1 MAG: Phosphoglycolate phosphatase [Brockia lithotrophica]